MPAPTWAANCSIVPFNAMPGSDSGTSMTVRSGASCGVQMNVRGGGVQMTVAQQASNGTASTPSSTSFSYVSRPGFVGKDRFVVDSTGELMEAGRNRIMRGTSHLTIDVDVIR